MPEQLEQRCYWWSISREQRAEEENRGNGHSGTETYEAAGCYKCDGKNTNCEIYLARGEDE